MDNDKAAFVPETHDDPLVWFCAHALADTPDYDTKAASPPDGQPHKVTMFVNGVEVNVRGAIVRLMEYCEGQHGKTVAQMAADQFGDKIKGLEDMVHQIGNLAKEKAVEAGLEFDWEDMY
jgi:hypothetical protein